MRRVLRTNQYGVQLCDRNGYWSISQPNDDGSNSVYHVGKEKYIKKLWNQNFTIVYDTCPVTGCRMVVHGQEKRDNSILVS